MSTTNETQDNNGGPTAYQGVTSDFNIIENQTQIMRVQANVLDAEASSFSTQKVPYLNDLLTDRQEHTIHSFVARPKSTSIDQMQYLPGQEEGTQVFALNVADLIYYNPNDIQKITGFNVVDFEVEVTTTIAASPNATGGLAFFWLYPRDDQEYFLSQHVLWSPLCTYMNINTDATMTMRWRYDSYAMAACLNSQREDGLLYLPTLYCYQLGNFRSVDTQPLTIFQYYKFNYNLYIPTSTNPAQVPLSPETYKVLHHLMANMDNKEDVTLPLLIDMYKKAEIRLKSCGGEEKQENVKHKSDSTEADIDLNAKINIPKPIKDTLGVPGEMYADAKRLIGLSKPSDVDKGLIVMNQTNKNMTTMDGANNMYLMADSVYQEIPFVPDDLTTEEMMFITYFRKKTKYTTVHYSVNSTPGQILYKTQIHPHFADYTPDNNVPGGFSNPTVMTPTSFIAYNFYKWMGTALINFSVQSNQAQSGKLLIGFVPGGNLNEVLDGVDFSRFYHEVVDLSALNSFTFKCDYKMNKEWLSTRNKRTDLSDLPEACFSSGVFFIQARTKLVIQNAATTPDTCDLLLWSSWDDNLRFNHRCPNLLSCFGDKEPPSLKSMGGETTTMKPDEDELQLGQQMPNAIADISHHAMTCGQRWDSLKQILNIQHPVFAVEFDQTQFGYRFCPFNFGGYAFAEQSPQIREDLLGLLRRQFAFYSGNINYFIYIFKDDDCNYFVQRLPAFQPDTEPQKIDKKTTFGDQLYGNITQVVNSKHQLAIPIMIPYISTRRKMPTQYQPFNEGGAYDPISVFNNNRRLAVFPNVDIAIFKPDFYTEEYTENHYIYRQPSDTSHFSSFNGLPLYNTFWTSNYIDI
jgi:hypothetical protein